MLKSIGKQSGEYVNMWIQSWRRIERLRLEGFAEKKENFKPGMKEWGVMGDENGESLQQKEEMPLEKLKK